MSLFVLSKILDAVVLLVSSVDKLRMLQADQHEIGKIGGELGRKLRVSTWPILARANYVGHMSEVVLLQRQPVTPYSLVAARELATSPGNNPEL
jgi:hypothetical protein